MNKICDWNQVRRKFLWIAFFAFCTIFLCSVGFSAESDSPPQEAEKTSLNLLDLVFRGGFLMIPLAIISVAVIAIIIERFLGLRKSVVMPQMLINGLSDIASVPGVMDPRNAYRLCQENKSPTARIIQTMLLKIGRPHSEVENAVSDASQREASRLYAHVRWLNLAAAISPLIGLLGTVWGMIQAFFRTTQYQLTQNKADFLAEGIYVALVTTLSGLAVAIPAAICAHYFEGRIQTLFNQIDELVFNLTPQIERFEGKMRVSAQSLSGREEPTEDRSHLPPEKSVHASRPENAHL